MRTRYLLLAVLLLVVALTNGGPPVKFIHPKSRLVLAGIRGTDVPWQVWAERHEANRKLRVEWWGEGCSGSFERDMAGEGAPRLYPDDGFRLAHLEAGVCLFTASVYGSGGKLRHRATLEVCAAGGEVVC